VALRAGDVQGLVAVLDPELAVRADAAVAAAVGGFGSELRGAEFWAKQAIANARGAKFARPALVDGTVGVVIAPRGKLFRVLRFTFANGKIAQIEIIGDAAGLDALDLSVLENAGA